MHIEQIRAGIVRADCSPHALPFRENTAVFQVGLKDSHRLPTHRHQISCLFSSRSMLGFALCCRRGLCGGSRTGLLSEKDYLWGQSPKLKLFRNNVESISSLPGERISSRVWFALWRSLPSDLTGESTFCSFESLLFFCKTPLISYVESTVYLVFLNAICSGRHFEFLRTESVTSNRILHEPLPCQPWSTLSRETSHVLWKAFVLFLPVPVTKASTATLLESVSLNMNVFQVGEIINALSCYY